MGAPPRIGCLVDEAAGDEQATAYEWCGRRFESVSRCRPGEVDSAAHDVLWWHRSDPVTAEEIDGERLAAGDDGRDDGG